MFGKEAAEASPDALADTRSVPRSSEDPRVGINLDALGGAMIHAVDAAAGPRR